MNLRVLCVALVLIISIWYVQGNSQEEFERRQLIHRNDLQRYMRQNRVPLTYKEYVRRNALLRKYYTQQFAKKKKNMNRCKQTPFWTVNGTHPVLTEVNKGNHVALFLMKNGCRKCWAQLEYLHDWAIWAKKVGKPISIIALMHHKYGNVTEKFNRQWFPMIKIYNEPKNMNIFKLLKGQIRSLFLYDKCGRYQYHIGPRFSSMVQPYTKAAIQNTMNHYKTFCGSCEPIVLPTNLTEMLKEGPAPTETNYNNIAGPAKQHKLH